MLHFAGRLFLAAAFTVSTFGISSAHAAGIAPSTDPIDTGIVAGAFSGKPKLVIAGGVSYHVIEAYLVEPACNPTQVVLWVEDENLEGDSGGLAYNLGLQISSIDDVKDVNGYLEVTYTRNDVSDCSVGIQEKILVKYPGAAGALEVL